MPVFNYEPVRLKMIFKAGTKFIFRRVPVSAANGKLALCSHSESCSCRLELWKLL